ncbi:Arf17p [Stylosanthes scabra]|uniref:Auxin response factor n=1 Tax=Stylosanthes scabra TaxID=79078 RepID=A0ABU6URA2_9FABA|nr:Arf17p [Stylosanthes scabra]
MPPSQPRRLPPKAASLDPKIWRACAGAAVHIPALHSRVYYFPEGHLEQAFPPSLHNNHHHHHLNPLTRTLPFVLCRVSAVQFLADPLSDEVFAKLLLTPIAADDRSSTTGEDRPPEEPDSIGGDKVSSFAKILTPSDANNGGGFSVPRFCADSIFPPLDYTADPPVQVLNVTDVHGATWDFRHIYRGTPRRHLLTTGWSKFVNHKKLVAGDSVVFMKNSQGSLFVGIRRTLRFSAVMAENRDQWLEEEEEEENSNDPPVFTRDGKGKVTVKAVAEAAELAVRAMPFEVVYYPRAGWSDFVVKSEAVEGAMKAGWCPGMRVKMAVETEDSSRMTWFQGTVSSASAPDNGPWRGSPWRMLQVTWDEPEVLQNSKRISPWQVEIISTTPSLHTVFPPTKRFRAGALSDLEGDPYFPITGFTNSTMEHMSQTLLGYNTFPAGMQGARHDLFSPSSFSNFLNGNSHLHMGSSFFGKTTEPMLSTVSTELNIGNCQSGDFSPDSPSSLRSFGPEFTGTNNSNVPKIGSGSFLLFGKIIKPVEVELHDAGCIADDGCKSSTETECIDKPVDHSLTYSTLLRLDVESQQPSPVEACYL